MCFGEIGAQIFLDLNFILNKIMIKFQCWGEGYPHILEPYIKIGRGDCRGRGVNDSVIPKPPL